MVVRAVVVVMMTMGQVTGQSADAATNQKSERVAAGQQAADQAAGQSASGGFSTTEDPTAAAVETAATKSTERAERGRKH